MPKWLDDSEATFEGLRQRGNLRARREGSTNPILCEPLPRDDLRTLARETGFEHEAENEDWLDALITATEGRPLLIELAFRALYDHELVDTLTTNQLLRGHIGRLRGRLAAAGFEGGEAEQALALATLLGGLPAHAADEHLPGPLRSLDSLQRIFPAASRVELDREVPPIRPELVGCAFIKAVWENMLSASIAKQIAVAWQIAPNKLAPTVSRLIQFGELSHSHRAQLLVPPEDHGAQQTWADAVARLVGAADEQTSAVALAYGLPGQSETT